MIKKNQYLTSSIGQSIHESSLYMCSFAKLLAYTFSKTSRLAEMIELSFVIKLYMRHCDFTLP